MNARMVAALAVALLLLIFAAQNYQVVELRFLFWKIAMSRAVVIVGVFLGGLVAGLLLAGVRRVARP